MGKCANENTEEKYCVSFALIDISYRRIDSCLNSFNELLCVQRARIKEIEKDTYRFFFWIKRILRVLTLVCREKFEYLEISFAHISWRKIRDRTGDSHFLVS